MELLEFTQRAADKEGNKIDPTQLDLPPDVPKEMYAIIGFKAKGEMTELAIRIKDAPTGQMYVYALAGYNQPIHKLAESLAGS